MNEEQYTILKSGVENWNQWREENPNIKIDLSSADLSYADLCNAKLSDAYLRNTDLRFADLRNTNLRFAELRFAYLRNADLRFADLRFANLTEANLENTNLTYCKLDKTIFGLTNLSTCKGLESVIVSGECVIDFKTLQASGKLSNSFYQKLKLPHSFIDYLPEFKDNPIEFFSVFLSHSWVNKEFVRVLYEELNNRGIHVWYDEKSMDIGEDIYESISEGVKKYDKVILVCSEAALESWWVDQELNLILDKERELQKKGIKDAKLLIPITVDDHIFNWKRGKHGAIKSRKIGDFQEVADPQKADPQKWDEAVKKLINALNVNRKGNNPLSIYGL